MLAEQDSERRRRDWLAVLAKTDTDELTTHIAKAGPVPPYVILRGPESGLAMVRARAGGSGDRFNLGEMTLTRCTIRMGDIHGVAYVAGRDRRHAELAALFDALLQQPDRHHELMTSVVWPLRREQRARQQAASRKANATKVQFFTMTRGEDPK